MTEKRRNILLITTDQMRFDALGCNGGKVARTPCINSLAAEGINYQRAHNNHVVYAGPGEHHHRPACGNAWRVDEWRHATRGLPNGRSCIGQSRV